jgi:hypothetical protein
MFLRTTPCRATKEHHMQQFIPFEDDWDALENLRPEDLIPYRVGLRLSCDPMVDDRRLTPQAQVDTRFDMSSGRLARLAGSRN